MHFLKQSTAVDVLIGPFLDITDGITAEVGETPTVWLSKNGQTLATKNDVTVPVHDAGGYYNCEFDATDTNTIGTMRAIVAASANATPVFHDFQVVEAGVYNALFASSSTLLTAKDVALIYEADISTVNSQTSFDMGTNIDLDDNWIGLICLIEDASTTDTAVRWVSDVVAASDRIIINSAPGFTVTAATPDTVRVFGSVHPQYANSLQNDVATSDLDTALSSIGLNFLVNTALPTDWATNITANSALDYMAHDGSTGYERTTDSLQEIKDGQAAILTTQMTESYAADGVAPTLAQAVFLMQQMLTDFEVSSTTLTVKKLDGSTTAATFTLDDADAPTSITRAT